MAIDPAFLEELERFDVAERRELAVAQQGERRSQELGEGLTFSDFRRYVQGDDPGLIDWKIYGRTDELYIKQFEAERSMRVHALVDTSASMDFADRAKFERAAKIALGYCYLFAADHDDFRFATLSERPHRLDSGASTPGELLSIIDRLNGVSLEDELAIRPALEAYAGTTTARSLIVLGSDFLVDPDALAAGLDALGDHEVVLVNVVAPAEISPPVSGETIFEGLETVSRLRTYFSPRREQQYREDLEAHWAELQAVADRHGAEYVRVRTDRDFFEAFAEAWIG